MEQELDGSDQKRLSGYELARIAVARSINIYRKNTYSRRSYLEARQECDDILLEIDQIILDDNDETKIIDDNLTQRVINLHFLINRTLQLHISPEEEKLRLSLLKIEFTAPGVSEHILDYEMDRLLQIVPQNESDDDISR